LSHCWHWQLEQVDKSKAGFLGWAKVRPLERQLIDCMLKADAHLIATMRSKTEWLIEKDERGRNVPKKIGTAPVQAKGIEYEFDIFGELTIDHLLMITKSRCDRLSNRSFLSPGVEVANILKEWTKANSSEPLRFVSPDEVDNLPVKTKIPEVDNHQQIQERKVTKSQLKRLYSLATESGLSNEEAKAIIENSGYKSSKDILMKDYDQIVEAIQNSKVSGNVWETWKTEDEAIAYCCEENPTIHMNAITIEWNRLVDSSQLTEVNSKVWYDRVQELKKLPVKS